MSLPIKVLMKNGFSLLENDLSNIKKSEIKIHKITFLQMNLSLNVMNHCCEKSPAENNLTNYQWGIFFNQKRFIFF